MMEDQINCRTQGLATHQEPWDWTSDVPLCQKTVWMLLRSLQWGVTVLPWELVLLCGGFEYWDDATQKLSMRKLDNLDQQMIILVEELRGSTFMRYRVYYLTMGVVDNYVVEELWGPGRGHPGTKILQHSEDLYRLAGVPDGLEGLLLDVNMRDQGITKSPTDKSMGVCQLGAVRVARQWMQEKTVGSYKERNREDYMQIKRNFFSPPLM